MQKDKTLLRQLKDLTLRELNQKYRSATLGILWAALVPLFLMLAITFVFMKVLKIADRNFPLFLLSGIIPWLFFSNTLVESTQSFIKDKPMLHQFPFPKWLFPAAIALSNLIQHLIGLAVLLPIFIFHNFHLSYLFIYLILPILSLTLFNLGVALISGIVNLFLRDLEHFLGVGLMILFWLTPIFYSSQMVPPNYRFIIYLNPLTHYIELYHRTLLKGFTIPIPLILLTFLIGIVTLGLAFFIYCRIEGLLMKKI